MLSCFSECFISKNEEIKLRNEFNTIAEIKYDPMQCPANIKLSKLHQISCRVGKHIDLDNDNIIDLCPCCAEPFDNVEVPLWIDHNKLEFIGVGFPLFYEFLIYTIFFISFLFIVQGIYSLYNNSKSEAIYLNPTLDNYCPNIIINKYSWANNIIRNDTQSLLSLICSFILLLSLFLFKNRLKTIETKLDNSFLSPSDFTAQISNIPNGTLDEEILNYLINSCDRKMEIVKIVKVYDVNELMRLKKLNTQLLYEKRNLLSKTIKNQTKICQIDNQFSCNITKIKEIEDSFEANTNISGFKNVIFVSFLYEEDVDFFVKQWQHSFLYEIYLYLKLKFNITTNETYKGNIISIKRAPEPTDLIWENLGFTVIYRFKAILITNLITFFCLASSAGIIFIISYFQKYNEQNGKEIIHSQINNQLIAIAESCLLLLINFILELFIKKLVDTEKPESQTEYCISLATKLSIAQFLNTAIVSFVVNYVIEGDEICTKTGMINNAFVILLSNAIIPLITYLFNFSYICKLIKRVMLTRRINNNYTQLEANSVFEGPTVDVSLRYVIPIKILLITTFYCSVLPISLLFCLGNLTLYYWIDKYILIKRCKKPKNLGASLSNEMVDIFIEFALASYSIGCAAFEKLLFGSLSWYVITQLSITVFNFVFPVHWISNKFIKKKNKIYSGKTYHQAKNDFLTDYDRSNPALQNKEMKLWMDERNKKELENKDINKSIKIKHNKILPFIEPESGEKLMTQKFSKDEE